MTKAARFAWLALLALACATPAPRPRPKRAAGIPPRPPATAYACPDGTAFTVRVAGPRAQLELAGHRYELPQVPAASGAKYSAGGTTFWSRGNEAYLEAGGFAHSSCRPAAAP